MLLFTINWADSGPRFSWPVEYRAVAARIRPLGVTASADTDEGYGYFDFALGAFPKTRNLVKNAGKVIRSDWSAQAAYSQCRWAYVLDEGIVDKATASRWADEIVWYE